MNILLNGNGVSVTPEMCVGYVNGLSCAPGVGKLDIFALDWLSTAIPAA